MQCVSMIGPMGLFAGSWLHVSTRPSPAACSSSRFADSMPRGETLSTCGSGPLPQPAADQRHFVCLAELMLQCLLTKCLHRELCIWIDSCLYNCS